MISRSQKVYCINKKRKIFILRSLFYKLAKKDKFEIASSQISGKCCIFRPTFGSCAPQTLIKICFLLFSLDKAIYVKKQGKWAGVTIFCFHWQKHVSEKKVRKTAKLWHFWVNRCETFILGVKTITRCTPLVVPI